MPPGPAARSATPFRADVEGLRGVAVLMVVLFHAGIGPLRGGFVGVDVFFVLSGYLITGLLVQEFERTGSIDFRRFYGRRARRLLPAATLVTLTVLLAGLLLTSPIELEDIARAARATAAYLSNVRFMLRATDYFDTSNASNPLLHTWSLAVEEQFYLFWPFMLWAGMRGARSRARATWLIAIVTVVTFACCLWWTRTSQPLAFFGSPARAWEFGVGALARLIPATDLLGRRHLDAVLGAAGLLIVCLSGLMITEAVAFPGLAAAFPVLGTAAVLIAGATAPRAGAARVLGTAPLQYLGRLSYSWYLWHWPVLVFADAWFGDLSATERLAAVALSLVISFVAYRWVENPIRFAPRLLAAPASRSLWLAAALTGGTIVVATGFLRLAHRESARTPYRDLMRIAADRGRIYDQGCMVPFSDGTPHECIFGDQRAAFTVVAFGDSHTAHWYPAMEELATQHHWRLVYFVKSGCPSVDVPIYNRFLKRIETECADWRTRVFARIKEIRPGVVVLSNSDIYVKEPGFYDPVASATAEEWQRGLGRTLTSIEPTGARIVLLRDTPRPKANVPVCLARAAWRAQERHRPCSITPDHALNEEAYRSELSASQRLARVSVVDLTSSFCDPTECDAVRDGIVVYRDDSHITPEFARHLAPVLGAALDRALVPAGTEPPP